MKKVLSTFLIVFFLISGCETEIKTETQTEITHYMSEEMSSLDLPFSDAVIAGNTIYVSGQIGSIPGKLELVEGGIEAETRQALENINRILEANGSSLDKAVKLTVMMDKMSEWPAMNEVYKEYFPGEKPARSAFGADGLALDARLEIDCVAVIN